MNAPVVDAWLTAAVASPWLPLVLYVLVVADAFLVVLPSETFVVALGALALSTGSPSLWLVIPVAALGAITGDSLCYLLGRQIGTDRRWLRGPRISAAIARARTAINERPATLIVTARYIPFARIAVNLTAGSTRFPLRRYLPIAAAAGLGWAIYNSVVGALFGAWLSQWPVLAIVVAVLVAIATGLLIDAVIRRIRARRLAAGTVDLGDTGQ
jgi:membrane-associated protein